ncbi:MAG: NAD(P)H-hydrate dehydratase, partial [Gemmatimonadota bacterium]|nr:NAD(P)H-hydrate dehydratase [Gemmatimonadota bacterium]
PDAHRGDGADTAADNGPDAMDTLARCDALALGPGLGRGAQSAALLERVMTAHRDRDRDRALVLDADALWLIADVAQSLGTDPAAVMRHWTRSARSVVCTPHPGEFAQLLGRAVPAAWDERAAALQAFAVRSGAIVLLKGTPTLIATPDGAPLQVAPYGTPLLATGGSGDLLTGVIVALLGQGIAPATAAAAGAAAHGRAAELATARLGGVLGGTLEAVLQAFPEAWHGLAHGGARAPGVLAELPSPLSIAARFA